MVGPRCGRQPGPRRALRRRWTPEPSAAPLHSLDPVPRSWQHLSPLVPQCPWSRRRISRALGSGRQTMRHVRRNGLLKARHDRGMNAIPRPGRIRRRPCRVPSPQWAWPWCPLYPVVEVSPYRSGRICALSVSFRWSLPIGSAALAGRRGGSRGVRAVRHPARARARRIHDHEPVQNQERSRGIRHPSASAPRGPRSAAAAAAPAALDASPAHHSGPSIRRKSATDRQCILGRAAIPKARARIAPRSAWRPCP